MHCVVATCDNKFLNSCSFDKSIRVWDLDKLKVDTVLSGHEGSVSSMVVTSEGRFIASAAWDNTLRI